MGLPPRGLTMGKSALRIKRVFFAPSNKRVLRVMEYNRGRCSRHKTSPGWTSVRLKKRANERRILHRSLSHERKRKLESRFHFKEQNGRQEKETAKLRRDSG